MRYDLRELTDSDTEAAWNLGSLAFGYHKEPRPEGWSVESPGKRSIGVFDSSGSLLAKAVDRDQGQWFGGRIIPTSGVAGVAVAPESRKLGLGRTVLTQLLADARDRGAVISTLYPTTPFPYRALGWDEVGALTYTAFPATALAAVRGSLDLRAAVASDFPAIEALYRSVAQSSTGLMERSGPLFAATPQEFLDSFDGVTLALSPAGDIVGYASWTRSSSYDSTGKITVYDLIGTSPEATASLLSFFGGWASVAPTIVIRLSDQDPARYLFSQVGSAVESRQPWMLRIVDAVGAITARGWAPVNFSLGLSLTDPECPWNAGTFQLTVADGAATLEPGGTAAVQFTPRGLALWYAGLSPAILRRTGFLTGDTASDPQLTAATSGPVPVLHDYF